MAADSGLLHEDEILPGHVQCPTCEGRGTDSCGDCNGTGRATHTCDRGYEHEESCDACDDGVVECFECGGLGQILDRELDTDAGL